MTHSRRLRGLLALLLWALMLALGAALAIFQFKVGMLPTLAAACAAGVVLHLAGAI